MFVNWFGRRFSYEQSVLHKAMLPACFEPFNDKACADDDIRNEFIKAFEPVFMHIYFRLFNIVLNTGHVPEVWTKGFIVPIFKKKGSRENPDNYRRITILSCMGKLFATI